MNSTMNVFLMSALITIIILLTSMILSKKNSTQMEKASPFECGFDPMKSARQPFSLRFFLITLLFLVFDAEIALILPLIPNMHYNLTPWISTTTFLFIVLVSGTYYEWFQGIMEWMLNNS